MFMIILDVYFCLISLFGIEKKLHLEQSRYMDLLSTTPEIAYWCFIRPLQGYFFGQNIQLYSSLFPTLRVNLCELILQDLHFWMGFYKNPSYKKAMYGRVSFEVNLLGNLFSKLYVTSPPKLLDRMQPNLVCSFLT